MSDKFAAETIDSIVDFLYDDRESLFVCSLVSKTWLPSARYHLFSQVSVCHGHSNFSRLLNLLGAPLNTIAPFVRQLTLDGLGDQAAVIDAIDGGELSQLFYALQGVESIQLCTTGRTRRRPLVPEFTAILHDHLKKLRNLDIRDVVFSSFFEFATLVCGFSSLQTLSVTDVTWKRASLDAHSDPCFHPSTPLRSCALDISNGHSQGLFEWLVTQNSTLPMQKLVCDTSKISSLPALRTFILSTGSFLVDVHLRFPSQLDVRSTEVLHNFIDLGPCTNLRSLSLSAIALEPKAPVASLIKPWIPQVLDQITSHQVEVISLSVMLHTAEDFGNFDCCALMERLSRPQFSHLKRLALSILHDSISNINYLAVEKTIRQDRLHALDTRGILNIEFLTSQ